MVTTQALIDKFTVPSQTSSADKVALEVARYFIEQEVSPYTYLELGSYLGGTLVPHLLSPLCKKIYSVDRRVDTQPDERRPQGYSYKGVTTEQMMQELDKAVELSHKIKLSTYNGDSSDFCEVVRNVIKNYFDLAFIDAEHTHDAVFRDFLNIEQLMKDDSVVIFHDTYMVYSGIRNILTYLASAKRSYFFTPLGGEVSAVFLGRYSIEHTLPWLITKDKRDIDQYMEDCKKRLWLVRKSELG